MVGKSIFKSTKCLSVESWTPPEFSNTVRKIALEKRGAIEKYQILTSLQNTCSKMRSNVIHGLEVRPGP